MCKITTSTARRTGSRRYYERAKEPRHLVFAGSHGALPGISPQGVLGGGVSTAFEQQVDNVTEAESGGFMERGAEAVAVEVAIALWVALVLDVVDFDALVEEEGDDLEAVRST